MTRLPAYYTPHTVHVEPYEGEGGNGPVFGESMTFSPADGNGVYCEDSQELVRDMAGREVVSMGKVYFSFEDAPAVESRVTVWPGSVHERTSTVLRVSRFEHPDWPGFAVVYLR